ncbi:MAG: hypothetical protein ABF313_20490, partial [Marivita sp.]
MFSLLQRAESGVKHRGQKRQPERKLLSSFAADFTTPDLSDANADSQVLPYQFRLFGRRIRFGGRVSTVACYEDNSRVAEAV